MPYPTNQRVLSAHRRNLQKVPATSARQAGGDAADPLGWAGRLARYYKDGGIPIGEIPPPQGSRPNGNSGRQDSVPQSAESKPQHDKQQQNHQHQQDQAQHQARKARFQTGQKLKATITNIKGNEVTFQILGTDTKLTQKEPKRAGSLAVGQEVQVEVLDLREDGRIRKAKLL